MPNPTECLECDSTLYRKLIGDSCVCFTGFIEIDDSCVMDCDI